MDVPVAGGGHGQRSSGSRSATRSAEGTPILLLDRPRRGRRGRSEPPRDADRGRSTPTLVAEQAPGAAAEPAAATPAPRRRQRAGRAAPARARPDFAGVHASPACAGSPASSGVDLTAVTGTGPKGRITKEDVKAVAARGGPQRPRPRVARRRASRRSRRSRLREVRAGRDAAAVPHPADLRARTCTARWLNVPHVTHDDEADITDLEAYRKELDTAAQGGGLPGHAARLPDQGRGRRRCASSREFNSSLTPEKDALILQELLPPRRRGRHARGPGGAGDPRRRPQGHHRDSARSSASSRRRRATASSTPADMQGGMLHDLQPRRHRRHRASRRSSTRPRWPSSACRGRRWRRSGTAARSCRG